MGGKARITGRAIGNGQDVEPPAREPAEPPAARPPVDIKAARRRRFVEELYATCWDDLCGWLRRRYGPGPPEPEDIAQAAFEKIAALDDVERIRNPRAFAGWRAPAASSTANSTTPATGWKTSPPNASIRRSSGSGCWCAASTA